MTQETNPRPNVLLICVDHWSGLLQSGLGHPTVMTPTIDQLSQVSVNFTNCYSACPVCIPARRTLMTGLTTRSHHDRCFNETQEMPPVPTLAQCFRDAGYQAFASGKLHVFPQRDRIGFDEVMLNEEGRHHLGLRADDWEQSLADAGYAGREYATGVCNNDYIVQPWHLPDHLHQTNWTAEQMCRQICRRDPRKPGFFYLSFAAPHPPMWPLRSYLELYRDVPLDEPVRGQWLADAALVPPAVRAFQDFYRSHRRLPHEIELARRAFYAAVTHIDHQIRVVLGCLREQKLTSNTIIAFTADHGDMLGDHLLWGKSLMYEMSAKVPLLVSDPRTSGRMPEGRRDSRLAELRDVMPTLLDLAGLPIPKHVEGHSLAPGAAQPRPHLYGEINQDVRANRMMHDGRFKLIWFPAGNHVQLFDLQEDPRECQDLAHSPAHAEVRTRLAELLVQELYGCDAQWTRDGKLTGYPFSTLPAPDTRTLSGQRGLRFMY